ncbi:MULTISPECIES: hypothetical protein [Stenotrophomonas]|uniref:hypothetical protein n=1 Tax=Stenotrophomonas TaxID=40323 RepID=UPI000770469D|nr:MULTISPECIES: hypothetical protein [Stenotrophomonas]AMJ56440.1 hypothetical protein AXG53_07105 [Stenotrophomonas sp. KCTC 12332]
MSIYTDLLFMHGHITNVALAKQLAEDAATPPAREDIVAAGEPPPRNGRERRQADEPMRKLPRAIDACSNR